MNPKSKSRPAREIEHEAVKMPSAVLERTDPIAQAGDESSSEISLDPPAVREATKAYQSALDNWREIEPKVAGRHLHGLEWHIASEAWIGVVEARKALDTALQSALIEATQNGQQTVVAALHHHEMPELPPAPMKATIPPISLFELVQTAALLASAKGCEVLAEFDNARECLIQAASSLKDHEIKPLLDFAQLGGVPFDVILRANDKNNKGLKPLPGVTTDEGLAKLIRRFYEWNSVGEAAGDLTGERFIEKRFLPVRVLVEIRAWRRERKRRNASKGLIGSSQNSPVNENSPFDLPTVPAPKPTVPVEPPTAPAVKRTRRKR